MATQIQILTQIQLDAQVSKFLNQPFKLLIVANCKKPRSKLQTEDF
ncbi:MAG: hypothetical protein ACM37W_28445 [Actinomycetota bacterium]